MIFIEWICGGEDLFNHLPQRKWQVQRALTARDIYFLNFCAQRFSIISRY